MVPNQLYVIKEKRNNQRTNNFIGVADTLYGLNRYFTTQRNTKSSRNLQGIQEIMRSDKTFKALIAMRKKVNPQRFNKLRGQTYFKGDKKALDVPKWLYTIKGKYISRRSNQLILSVYTKLALIRQVFLINMITG